MKKLLVGLMVVIATCGVARGQAPHLGVFYDGLWIIESGSIGWQGETPMNFGWFGDYALLVDTNGDGQDELIIFRDGSWFRDLENDGWNGEGPFLAYGLPGDIPFLADLDGDQIDEAVLYRDGWWYVDWELDGWNGEGAAMQFGGFPGDIPVAGDLNHDGRDEVGIVRGNQWYMEDGANNGWNGEGPKFNFSGAGYPLIGDIDGDGSDEAVYFDRGNWRVRDGRKYAFGFSGATPVIGNIGNTARREILPSIDFRNRETHKGVFGIRANGGNSLLKGCGFGFIGSQTGADNNANVTSCRWRDGAMRQFRGNTLSLPSELHFVEDTWLPTRRIYFGGHVGSAPNTTFESVSMPMDADRSLFSHFRHNGLTTVSEGRSLPTLARFDQLQHSYIHEGSGQSVRIGAAQGGAPNWGEIIGDQWTVRVTLTGQSRPMGLFFVDHPGIGVRNVEFSFGRLKKGEVANVTGYIEVYRTDPALLMD